jgi:hypothetical protein
MSGLIVASSSIQLLKNNCGWIKIHSIFVTCSKLISNWLTKLQRNSTYAYKFEKSSTQNKRSTSLSLSLSLKASKLKLARLADVAIPGQ